MLHLTPQPAQLKKARQILKQGGVVVVPTDTAYGLAADPRHQTAIKRIFKIKQRPPEKALPWIAGSLEQVRRFFHLSSSELKLAQHFWPGPLSLVLRHRRSRKKIAIRVPAVASIRNLTRAYGHPLTATSANRSGKPNSYSPRAVERQFARQTFQPDALIDVGQLRRRRPSTIVEMLPTGPVIHRPGPISEKNISNYV